MVVAMNKQAATMKIAKNNEITKQCRRNGVTNLASDVWMNKQKFTESRFLLFQE
jgi:hypothetical protein